MRVSNGVKCLGKVKENCVNVLVGVVKLVVNDYELSGNYPEAVLVVCETIVCVDVRHDVTEDDVFRDLTGYWCQRDWTILRWRRIYTFLEVRGHKRILSTVYNNIYIYIAFKFSELMTFEAISNFRWLSLVSHSSRCAREG